MVKEVGLESEKNNYASLDILKFIMALVVVARHIGGQLWYCLVLLCSAYILYYLRFSSKEFRETERLKSIIRSNKQGIEALPCVVNHLCAPLYCRQ